MTDDPERLKATITQYQTLITEHEQYLRDLRLWMAECIVKLEKLEQENDRTDSQNKTR